MTERATSTAHLSPRAGRGRHPSVSEGCRVRGRSANSERADRAPHPNPCMGLSLSSTDLVTSFFSHLLLSVDWSSVDGTAPIDSTSQAATAHRRTTARTRQSEASLPSGGDHRATTLYSVDPRGVIREDPNHDAVIRIGGEAPRRRAHSLPRRASHGSGRVTATSDRLGVASRRAG